MEYGIDYYKSLEPFWGEWRISRTLGEGAYGKVYEVERIDFGKRYVSALKAITIPQSESEWKSVCSEGMDEKSATAYFMDVISGIVDETALMNQLKGHGNIVSYEDHKVVEHEDKHGWDIFIRMELLTPFLDKYDTNDSVPVEEVVKLGIDICKALEFCHGRNILHRDIKPENIFVTDYGAYKLGDFGIARTVEKTMGSMSKKGTYNYMAPEVYLGKAYDRTVDIYSLGIVLYRLLNHNRPPFYPAYPEQILYEHKETALQRRMRGEELPDPDQATEILAKIIKKACAYKAEDRYQNAEEFRIALEKMEAPEEKKEETQTPPVIQTSETKTIPQPSSEEVKKKPDKYYNDPKKQLKKQISTYRQINLGIIFAVSIGILLISEETGIKIMLIVPFIVALVILITGFAKRKRINHELVKEMTAQQQLPLKWYKFIANVYPFLCIVAGAFGAANTIVRGRLGDIWSYMIICLAEIIVAVIARKKIKSGSDKMYIMLYAMLDLASIQAIFSVPAMPEMYEMIYYILNMDFTSVLIMVWIIVIILRIVFINLNVKYFEKRRFQLIRK